MAKIDIDKLVASLYWESEKKGMLSLCSVIDTALDEQGLSVSGSQIVARGQKTENNEERHGSFDKWVDDYWAHNKVNNPYAYDKGDELQFGKREFEAFCALVRKKVEDECQKEIDMAYKNAAKVQYRNGFNQAIEKAKLYLLNHDNIDIFEMENELKIEED